MWSLIYYKDKVVMFRSPTEKNGEMLHFVNAMAFELQSLGSLFVVYDDRAIALSMFRPLLQHTVVMFRPLLQHTVVMYSIISPGAG